MQKEQFMQTFRAEKEFEELKEGEWDWDTVSHVANLKIKSLVD